VKLHGGTRRRRGVAYWRSFDRLKLPGAPPPQIPAGIETLIVLESVLPELLRARMK
jgi:hypothetical protein